MTRAHENPYLAADVRELLDGNGAGSWVGIEVVMVAFGRKKSQAYQLGKDEQWRTAAGHYPKQFAFEDVRRTWWRLRGPSPITPTKGITQ